MGLARCASRTSRKGAAWLGAPTAWASQRVTSITTAGSTCIGPLWGRTSCFATMATGRLRTSQTERARATPGGVCRRRSSTSTAMAGLISTSATTSTTASTRGSAATPARVRGTTAGPGATRPFQTGCIEIVGTGRLSTRPPRRRWRVSMVRRSGLWRLTSMPTAGRISTWPTTASRTSCGSISRTAASETPRSWPVRRSTASAAPRAAWGLTLATSTMTETRTSS